MTRFTNISLGKDVKSNQKLIKKCPGPQDYDVLPADNNSVVKRTFNTKLNQGGIIHNKSSGENKDILMAKILLTSGNGKNATSPRGAGLGALVSTVNTLSSVFNKPQPEVDIILQNKMAVNSTNFSVMNGLNTT